MDSLSSFLDDLFSSDYVIGSLGDVDHISIVHDDLRLPSTSLINMNRRTMGMEDFHEPMFFKKEEKKKNRWEEELVRTTRSCPKLAVQDLASTTKAAERLLRPSRQKLPASPNSPAQELLMSEGLGGRTATRNLQRPTSSSMSCCVNEEIASPQANGVTRTDRQTFTRHLRDSIQAIPTRRCPISQKKEETSSDMVKASVLCSAEYGRHERDKGDRWCSLLREQQSGDSALVMPKRGVMILLPLQQTAVEELEEDEIYCLVSLALTDDEVEMSG
jgi:hypothetical protein